MKVSRCLLNPNALKSPPIPIYRRIKIKLFFCSVLERVNTFSVLGCPNWRRLYREHAVDTSMVYRHALQVIGYDKPLLLPSCLCIHVDYQMIRYRKAFKWPSPLNWRSIYIFSFNGTFFAAVTLSLSPHSRETSYALSNVVSLVVVRLFSHQLGHPLAWDCCF